MDWNERLGWLVLGMLAGFVLGYIVRSLREIKEELDEVRDLEREIVDHHPETNGNEDGLSRHPVLYDIVLLLIVSLTVFAAFSSQAASNKNDAIINCNTEFQAKTIKALNERTAYTTALTQANVELQKSQAKLVALIFQVPPGSEDAQRKAGSDYLSALNQFVLLSTKTKNKADEFPYPTPNEYGECLKK